MCSSLECPFIINLVIVALMTDFPFALATLTATTDISERSERNDRLLLGLLLLFMFD